MREIVCSFCDRVNFILELKCKNCGNLLHEKYNTIDLGELIYLSLFEPKFAAKRVLFSTKKNYLFILLILLILKFTLFSLYDASIIDSSNDLKLVNYLFIVFMWFIAILVINLLMKLIFELLFKQKISYFNILSITTYPFILCSISVFIIFPLELMLFGPYLFSKNPSIFDINIIKAILLTFLEILIFVYSMYLLHNFLNFVLDTKKISLLIIFVYLFMLYGINKLIINMGVVNL